MGSRNSNVSETLRRKIAAEGPIPFETFQDIALYGDGGFFASGPLRSSATGDFLTSPEVSPWFGKTVAAYLNGSIVDLETVVDVGAGSGSLLAELIATLPEPVSTWAVEASPMARASLAELSPAVNVTDSLQSIPGDLRGAVIANELIDNLPVSLAVRSGEGWLEHWVADERDGFVFVEVPARPRVAAWADQFGGAVPEGGIVEVQLAAREWLGQVIALVEQGVILLIDYGGTIEELQPRRQLGTLRTYRGHHLGPDPLLEPGETDITVDVNFSALVAHASSGGATATLHRQDDFLRAWGLRDVVTDLKLRELGLARSGDTMGQLTLRSERIDAETLLHPRGLGDFRVLIIEV